MQSTKTPTLSQGTRSFILATTFLNFAGAGIISPLLPSIVGQYTTRDQVAFVSSMLYTVFSLFTFIAVPTLGALSDRYGRRPILLISLIGSAVGYFLFGVGGSLAVLFAGRIIDGITGGNIATIYAYAADITEPKDRTKLFGIIGAVSGLAFIVGPAVGGLLFRLTNSYAAPMYFSAAIYLVNTLWGYFAMPESLTPERHTTIRVVQLNPLTQLVRVFQLAQLRILLTAIFVWTVAFAILQSNLSILTADKLGWQPDANSTVLVYIGIIGVVLQGALIPRLLRRIPEGRLAAAGMFIMAAGFLIFVVMALTLSVPLIFIGATILAIGYGLILPTTGAMVSKSVSPSEQGRASGGNQAVQALGRVVGPLLAGVTYGLSAAIPWAAAAGLVAVGGLLILTAIPILQDYRERMQASSVPKNPAIETT